MRTYRHTRTGAIITVNAEVRGEWEEITAPASSEAKTEEKKKPAPKRTKKK